MYQKISETKKKTFSVPSDLVADFEKYLAYVEEVQGEPASASDVLNHHIQNLDKRIKVKSESSRAEISANLTTASIDNLKTFSQENGVKEPVVFEKIVSHIVKDKKFRGWVKTKAPKRAGASTKNAKKGSTLEPTTEA